MSSFYAFSRKLAGTASLAMSCGRTPTHNGVDAQGARGAVAPPPEDVALAGEEPASLPPEDTDKPSLRGGDLGLEP